MKRKYNTHIVIKRADVEEHLSEEQRLSLDILLYEIERRRIASGKKMNSYHICNTDEPYAAKVLQVILDGEQAKEALKKDKED